MGEILLILAQGFEESEAVITIDVLRRMNFDVCIASTDGNLQVKSSHGVTIVADKILDSCKNEEFSAIILPGGMPGSDNLKNNLLVIRMIQKAHSEGALVCAICAAPIVLEKAGILDGVKFTVYPGFESVFKTPPLSDKVVRDKNIITGKGPGAAFDFALEISSVLGKDPSQIAGGMLLK